MSVTRPTRYFSPPNDGMSNGERKSFRSDHPQPPSSSQNADLLREAHARIDQGYKDVLWRRPQVNRRRLDKAANLLRRQLPEIPDEGKGKATDKPDSRQILRRAKADAESAIKRKKNYIDIKPDAKKDKLALLEALHTAALLPSSDVVKRDLNNDNAHYEQRGREVSQQVEKAVSDLRQSGPLPKLSDLPRDLRYKLYIDKKDHDKAQKLESPGELYDGENSPGYHGSMERVVDKLSTIDINNPKSLDSRTYATYHYLAATDINDAEQLRAMHKHGGVDPDRGEYNAFYNRWANNRSPEEYDRRVAHEEMKSERINGVPLFREMPETFDAAIAGYRPQEQLDQYIYRNYLRKGKYVEGDAMVIGFKQKDGEQSNTLIVPYYRSKDAMKVVDAVSRSYQEEVDHAQNDYQRLTAVARLVRTLHMIHPYQGGNGRTNIYGIMNKCLIEQGFSPAILPHGPDVFGGEKPLDGLVLDMVHGMQAFRQEVRQHDSSS
jgi:hypothetical protein